MRYSTGKRKRAIERKCPLLSIQEDNRAEELIARCRNKEPVEIANIAKVNTNALKRDQTG